MLVCWCPGTSFPVDYIYTIKKIKLQLFFRWILLPFKTNVTRNSYCCQLLRYTIHSQTNIENNSEEISKVENINVMISYAILVHFMTFNDFVPSWTREIVYYTTF